MDRADVPDLRPAATDIAPTGDLGVRAAIESLQSAGITHAGGDGKNRRGLARPYCSVASCISWRSLDNQGAM